MNKCIKCGYDGADLPFRDAKDFLHANGLCIKCQSTFDNYKEKQNNDKSSEKLPM